MRAYSAALSEHPLATHAVGEVVGQVLEEIGPGPDLVLCFATAAHGGALEDIAAAIRSTLAPATLLATTAVSVLAGAREVEEQPALALWAGRLDARAVPVRLEVRRTPEGVGVAGLPEELPPGQPLLLLADPFTFPVAGVLEHVAEHHPSTLVVGGLASAGRGPGGNRLVLDDRTYVDGAVGALLPPGAARSVVSQGCRPIGQPMIVTRAEGQLLHELAGEPALDRLMDLLAAASPEERAIAQRGLHVGVVIDERKEEFHRGDFLVRNVLGADREAKAVAVGDVVAVGTTVQFQVRDASSADEDLRELLDGQRAAGALVFTCNGRGTHLFGRPDHDAEAVSEHVDGRAVAGMFCAGEVGPVRGRSFLHGFTASVVLFDP